MKTFLVGLLKDQKSDVMVEYSIIFSLLGCFFGLIFATCALPIRSEVICSISIPSGTSHAANQANRDIQIFEKKWRLNGLARHLAISLESTRLLYKDEPDVIRVSVLRRKDSAPYNVPDSVARRVYCRHGGLDSFFGEEHYTIRSVASILGCGRETVRLLVRSETGVLKIRLGKKRAHCMYRIPKSVLFRLHTRLLNAS